MVARGILFVLTALLCACASVPSAVALRHHLASSKKAARGQDTAEVDLDALSRDLFKKFESAQQKVTLLGASGAAGTRSAASDSDDGDDTDDSGDSGDGCEDPCNAQARSEGESVVHVLPRRAAQLVAFSASGYPSSQAGVGPLAVNPYAVQLQLQQQRDQQALLQQRARLLGAGFNTGSTLRPVSAGTMFPMASMGGPPTAGSDTSIVPMGSLTAGFSPPLLPGVSLQLQLQQQQLRQQQLAALQQAMAPRAFAQQEQRQQRQALTADAAKEQAETIAKVANLTKALQSARNNLTLATWRLQAAEQEKQKREAAVLEKNIETFKMKASVATLTDRIESATAEAETLKAQVEKAAAKTAKALKMEDKAKAAFMDATEDLVDAKMAARQGGRQRAAVGMDVGGSSEQGHADVGNGVDSLGEAAGDGPTTGAGGSAAVRGGAGLLGVSNNVSPSLGFAWGSGRI
eukprot:INCI12517.2.p2 GENE.INCI12517.2~~INCI12517.2.p2  ORF type:complete len:462 (+),score=131.74 INCI12517.2:108-1493(+)